MNELSINDDLEENCHLNQKDLLDHDENKYQEDKKFEVDPNDIDRIFISNKSIIFKNISISFDFTVILVLGFGINFIILGLCRTKGFSYTEALSTFGMINDLFGCIIPYSLTTNYMYKSVEAYSSNNSRLYAKLYNKTNFILLLLGAIMLILFCFAFGPIFSIVSKNTKAVESLTEMLRWMSTGIIFWYLQFVIIIGS